MSYAQAIGAMPSKEDRNYIDPNSKFCRWCRKRFANENVYKAHLEGKKHLKALEAGGRKAEADAIRRRLADAKKMAAAKKAQEVAAVELQEAATKKRKQAEDPVAGEGGGGGSAEPEGAKKVARGEEGGAAPVDLAASASEAAKGKVSEQKVDLSDKDQQALAMAYASGTAKPMVNMAVGEKWWEGTQHFDADRAAANRSNAASTNGLDVTAGNRSTQIQARPADGPGSGGGDWQCPGNHFKGR
jgi:hypothetical protein